jgi:hypothetical protein
MLQCDENAALAPNIKVARNQGLLCFSHHLAPSFAVRYQFNPANRLAVTIRYLAYLLFKLNGTMTSDDLEERRSPVRILW